MDSFGLERSIEPRHALAQQAWKIDNTMTLRSDEVLIDVKIININLASFNEILDETGEDRALLCQRVLEIVRERGKLHNPVTNSGGMLYGTVVELGPSYPNIYHIRPKDEIISLSSLTVTPLHITQILRIDYESAQLEVEGQAILYANSPVVKKPPDLPLRAVIAAMDEAGAPTRSYQIVQPGQDVLILGASGRIGLMCGYAAKDKMGSSGRLVGIVRDQESRIQMEQCSVFDEVLELDATNLSAFCGTPHAEIIQRFDVVINCINTADTEAASLLAVKNHGTIYFATICCDYKFVALTAESIGKEIQVIPYTGFLEGHADYTLGLMRRFPQMQTDIQRGICGVPETRLRVLPVFVCINGVLYNIALCKGADGSFPIAVIPIVVLPFRADILLWLSVFGIGKPYRLPRFDRTCCALDIDHLTGDGSQRVYLGGFMVIEIINAIGIVPYSVQGECRGNQRKT